MERYVFSGSLTNEMHDILAAIPDFEPIDALESQLNRSSVKKMIEWRKQGFVRWLFIDSGAFSVHTGKADTTVDEYIEYINSIDDDIDVFAQLDTIPGTFGQPKKPEDYVNSAESSWENYLYMRERVKSPNKLMPVYHFGEDLKYLDRMLEWTDEHGNHLEYIGLSPANDASVEDRMIYLKDMYSHIAKSPNPHVKTHIYGFTSLNMISKMPCYSADSITHRLQAGYGRIFTQNCGMISVSNRVRSKKNSGDRPFIEVADEHNYKLVEDEIKHIGLTFEKLTESVAARVAMNIYTIQKLVNTKYKYSKSNLVVQKKLFSI